MSNGHPSGLQDEAVKKLKGYSKQFLLLLKNWKGKNKDATARDSANKYYAQMEKRLPGLFKKGGRWEQSSAEPLGKNFVAVWNKGNCKWSDAYEALKPLNDAVQQSE
jgi:hypothetical protein